MAKKLALVALVWVALAFSYIILTAAMPAITSITSMAGNSATQTGNYWGFNAAVSAAPVWVYMIPAGIALLLIVLILRAPES